MRNFSFSARHHSNRPIRNNISPLRNSSDHWLEWKFLRLRPWFSVVSSFLLHLRHCRRAFISDLSTLSLTLHRVASPFLSGSVWQLRSNIFTHARNDQINSACVWRSTSSCHVLLLLFSSGRSSSIFLITCGIDDLNTGT